MNTSNIKDDAESTAYKAELTKLICDHLHLSDAEIALINETMTSQQLDFSAAAISLNLVTQQQLAEVMELLNRPARPAISIIEAVRKKIQYGQTRSHAPMAEPDELCTPSTQLSIAHDPYSDHSERLRGLRTELTLRFGRSSQAAMLAIVSPGSNEGRSQLAAELAIAFAQLERRTLLVDADFRNPAQHKLFSCSNEHGLSDAITGNAPPFLVGIENLPFLRILPSGQTPEKPLETLSAKRLEQLVNLWRTEYDFVIIDTPPISAYADALTVSTLLKRVLITTRANQTDLSAAKEMLRRLAHTHAEVLGSVLNRF